MKNGIIRTTLAAAALFLSTNLALAVEATPVKVPDAKGAVKTSADGPKTGAKATADKAKAANEATQKTAKTAAKDTKAGAKAAVTDTKAGAKAAIATTKATATSAKPAIVDINSASLAELKAIPGVGDTHASKIIAGRPYANKTQLKTRNVLPGPVYEKVKDLLIAKQAATKTTPAKK